VEIVADYLDANPEFAKKYDYLVEWQMTEDESNSNFMAKFRLKPNGRQGQQVKDGGAPEAPPARGSALRSSSGQWRSQHAQQRERDISGNSRVYRENYTRETNGASAKENYNPRNSGSALRSNSPKRNASYEQREQRVVYENRNVQYVPVMKQT